MNKKILFLMLSTVLLASCKQDEAKKDGQVVESPSATMNSSSVVTDKSASSVTSVQQLNNEQIAVAQKELLKVLSVRDESLTQILKMSQSIGAAQSDEKKVMQLQNQLYEISLDAQNKLNQLKITNQEIKDYIKDQNDLTALTKKLYKMQDQIEKEKKNGKLSEANEALLKEMQQALGKVLQRELTLVESLSQSGDQSPVKELLQIKNIQNKEALQLASSVQMLMSDTSSDTEKSKKIAELTKKIVENSMIELKKLSIKTPEISHYCNLLIELSKLKSDSINRYEQLQKEMTENKKLSPESEKLAMKLQEDTLKAEKMRIELTTKYSQ